MSSSPESVVVKALRYWLASLETVTAARSLRPAGSVTVRRSSPVLTCASRGDAVARKTTNGKRTEGLRNNILRPLLQDIRDFLSAIKRCGISLERMAFARKTKPRPRPAMIRRAARTGLRTYFGTLEVSGTGPGLNCSPSAGVDLISAGSGLTALAVSTPKT
jgi:hypothetical protein